MKKVYEWLIEEYEMTDEQIENLSEEERDFFIEQYIEFTER